MNPPRLAEFEHEIATLRNQHAISQRRRHVGKQRRHIALIFKILLGRETFDATRIGQHLAFRDTGAGFVRSKFFLLEKLYRMSGHYR